MANEMFGNPDGNATGYHFIFDSAGRLYLIPAISIEDRPTFALANMIYDSTGKRICPLRSAPPPPEFRPIDASASINRTLYRSPTFSLNDFGGGSCF